MAINRGPWSTLVDDDGSNLTGSIWNKAAIQTVLLDPIDAALLPLATPLTTLFDASGAGLAITSPNCLWSQIGQIVFVWIQVIWPATANAAYASIGGLPRVVRVPVGGSQGYGVQRLWWAPQNQSVLQPQHPTTGAPVYNSEMSGSNNILSLVYVTDP